MDNCPAINLSWYIELGLGILQRYVLSHMKPICVPTEKQRDNSVSFIHYSHIQVYQGVVFVSTNSAITCAVKVSGVSLYQSSYYQDELAKEANVLSKLNHPNIIKYIGICIDHDDTYLIMEYMDGGSLLAFVKVRLFVLLYIECDLL